MSLKNLYAWNGGIEKKSRTYSCSMEKSSNCGVEKTTSCGGDAGGEGDAGEVDEWKSYILRRIV